MNIFKQIALILPLASASAFANPAVNTLTVNMHRVSAKGIEQSIGTINFIQQKCGVLIKPHLHGISPGMHGFHIHQNPSCQPAMKDGKMVAALKAGGHYDPTHSGKHLGPYNTKGHLGDLPALYVNQKGQAIEPVFAPRITLKDIPGHALMIHQGGDNYSDHPKALGGGGARLACGLYTPKARFFD